MIHTSFLAYCWGTSKFFWEYEKRWICWLIYCKLLIVGPPLNQTIFRFATKYRQERSKRENAECGGPDTERQHAAHSHFRQTRKGEKTDGSISSVLSKNVFSSHRSKHGSEIHETHILSSPQIHRLSWTCQKMFLPGTTYRCGQCGLFLRHRWKENFRRLGRCQPKILSFYWNSRLWLYIKFWSSLRPSSWLPKQAPFFWKSFERSLQLTAYQALPASPSSQSTSEVSLLK